MCHAALREMDVSSLTQEKDKASLDTFWSASQKA